MENVDILFIIPPFHMRNGSGSFFPMGIGYIISSLKKNNQTWGVINCSEIIQSFFSSDLEKLRKKLLLMLPKYSPLVIGIGPCVTTQLKALKIISETCNQICPEVAVFAGGPFASIDGQDIVFEKYLGIQYLIKGDGEYAVSDVIRTIKDGKNIESCEYLSYSGKSYVNCIDNIDDLPYPYRFKNNRDIFSKRRRAKGVQFAMIASRGCPYRCTYCVSGHMKDNQMHFRRRTNENIIDEMVVLRDDYGATSIIFYDDLFFPNHAKINDDVYNFCKALRDKKINMEWQIEMRPDYFVELSDLSIKSLFHAGCIQINLGIEKITEKGLEFLGKKGNRDGLQEKMRFAESIGICLSATFILGGKDEKEEDVKNIVEYAKSLPLEYAHFNPLFIYPGTPLYDEVYSTPVKWADDVLSSQLPWGEIVYENEYLKTHDLLELIDYAYAEFYKDSLHAKDNMIKDRFNLKEIKE